VVLDTARVCDRHVSARADARRSMEGVSIK
jgi:hypothetical protein